LRNPQSKEVPVPENRIVRTGQRNPLFRELHTLHAQRMEQAKTLTGKAKYTDPDQISMRNREQDIMEQLGLNYAREGEDISNMGQDWYVQTDPGRFERTVDEAKADDATFEGDARANGELRSQEQSVGDDFDADFDFDLDSINSRVYRAVIKHREGGKGYKEIKSSDGERIIVPNAYEGHDGELLRGLVSSQGAIEALSDGHGAASSFFRRNAVGHKAYNPPTSDQILTKGTKEYQHAVEYFHKWSDLLNTQIAHSPIWGKMLGGWSDEKHRQLAGELARRCRRTSRDHARRRHA
jgi:hypothetical protein